MKDQLERIVIALQGIEYNLELIKNNLESSTSGLNVPDAIESLELQIRDLQK